MRLVLCLVLICPLLIDLGGCAAEPVAGLDDYGARGRQVEQDVQAITAGMNHARAQAASVARAR